MRVPSGGRLASAALVRIMIQCWSSQAFAGKVNCPPVKVAPACNLIVSPQLALFSAPCRSPPAFTVVVEPGAGVSARVVLRYARGNSAGPSKLLFVAAETASVRLWFVEGEALSVTFTVKEYCPG